MKYELVKTVTSDDLRLTGLYYENEKSIKNKTLIIFIHGYMTDFYTWDFPQTITESISKSINLRHISVLLAQHRGTGIHTEFLNKDISKEASYIGSNFELLEDAYKDIDAWIEFAKTCGYEEIILMGHSLGTLKVTKYMFEGKHIDLVKKVILLAPYDKNGYLLENRGKEWKKLVEQSKFMVDQGHGEEMITKEFDDYPMSYKTYYSWYRQDNEFSLLWDFYNKDYISPALTKLTIPVKVIYGTEDVFLYLPTLSKLDDVEYYLKRNIKDVDITVIDGSEHCYQGYESIVAKAVCDFLIK